MKSYLKDIILSITCGIISGYITNVINTHSISHVSITWYILIIMILVGLCVYLYLFVARCRSHGIIKILHSSIKGEGSTEAYMKSATHSIKFVGIAASKWVKNADLLEKTIRSICSHSSGSIKFLLLNPNSEAAKQLSIAQDSNNEDSVSKKIEHSLSKLNEIICRISNNNLNLSDRFEIRLYDQMPVYRLTLIDDIKAYFCFYQKGCDGSKLKQFVIKHTSKSEHSQENILNSMLEYFESLWNAEGTVQHNLGDIKSQIKLNITKSDT